MIDYTNLDRYSTREENGKKIILRKEGKYWFGPFSLDKFYDIENSEDVVRNLRTKDKMKSVEFVFTKNKPENDKQQSVGLVFSNGITKNATETTYLTFVELKSSVPQLTPRSDLGQRIKSDINLKGLPEIVTEKQASFFEFLPDEFQKQALSVFDASITVPKTMEDVCDKFINSWRLLLSVAYDREKSDAVPLEMINAVKNTQTVLNFVLVLDIDENQLAETDNLKSQTPGKENRKISDREKIQQARKKINTVLNNVKCSLEELLKKRLVIERKICQTKILVMTITQARRFGLVTQAPT